MLDLAEEGEERNAAPAEEGKERSAITPEESGELERDEAEPLAP
jgi:hypothetical protein